MIDPSGVQPWMLTTQCATVQWPRTYQIDWSKVNDIKGVVAVLEALNISLSTTPDSALYLKMKPYLKDDANNSPST